MKRKFFIALMATVLVLCGGGLTGFCGDVATHKAVAPIGGYDLGFGHYTDGLQPAMMQAAFRDDYDMDYGHFTDSMEPSTAYAALIADYLQKCDCKRRLLSAKSPNIRKGAFIDTLKGAYVRVNQVELVRYMMGKNVAVNPRRVEYVINQLFTEQVSPQEVYAVLANEPIVE
jgi:hypothetical protein